MTQKNQKKNCYNYDQLKKICQVFCSAVLVFFVFIVILDKTQTSQAGPIEDIKQAIDAKQQEIKELERQAEEYKQSIKTKQDEKISLKNQIFIVDTQIEKLKIDIRITQSKINETSLKIDQLNLDINTQNREVAKQKQSLGEIIRLIAEYDKETAFELILKNNNFSDFLNQMEYAGLLQSQIQSKLENIQTIKIQLERRKKEAEEKKEEAEELESQLIGQDQVLDNQKDDKEDLLKTTKNQEWRYQGLLKEVQEKREEIQKDIFGLEDSLRNIINPSSIPAPRPGVLNWPTGGLLTQRYGPTSQTGFENHIYKFHNGIDLASGMGSPIKAALNGTVKGVGNNGKYAYGKWIAIEHNNGLTTLYGHLSAQNVSYGQEVKQDQIIGYEGTTGFSTGPHLHFTVYASNTFKIEDRWFGLLPLGGSINPMDYL